MLVESSIAIRDIRLFAHSGRWARQGAAAARRCITALTRLPVLLALTLLCSLPVQAREPGVHGDVEPIAISALPREARQTLALIKSGGPFPYPRDGVTFQNRERLLPLRPRNYYREYTVPTPGARTRGARRIVAGQRFEYYYTADHYRSFKRIIEQERTAP